METPSIATVIAEACHPPTSEGAGEVFPLERSRIHGLVVQSERSLPGEVVDEEAAVDLIIEEGDARAVPADHPGGRTLSLLEFDSAIRHVVARTAAGLVFRVPGLVDFEISDDLGRATVHRDPTADADLVHVLTCGALLAVILELQGATILHASAVELPGGVVAVVGPSGCGKSTIATLLCAAGGLLVADDLLRVDLAGESVQVWGGGNELRLREGAQELTRTLAGSRRVTADQRTGLTPAEVVSGPARELDLIVLPRLHRSPGQRVETTRLARAEALLEVLAAPRLLGWSDGSVLAHRFESVANLVARVPVLRLDLPWQRPFEDRFGHAIADELADVLSARP